MFFQQFKEFFAFYVLSFLISFSLIKIGFSNQEQINIIQSSKFHLTTLIFICFSLFLISLLGIINTSKDDENKNKTNYNNNIFTPIKFVLMISLFIPYNDNISVFSELVTYNIQLIQNLL